jgi:uncharacterized OB-fold protein
MSDLAACTICGALQAWKRIACQSCGARSFAPATLPLNGTVYSVTTIRRAPEAAYAADVPYSVALIRGQHGGLVMLRWDGPAPALGTAAVIMQAATGLIGKPG